MCYALGIVVIGALILYFIVSRHQDRMHAEYEMHASFAREWVTSAEKLTKKRDELAGMDIPPEDEEAKRYRDRVVTDYDDTIKRFNGYVEHWRSMIPEQHRATHKCP